jgi:hypothetical protein
MIGTLHIYLCTFIIISRCKDKSIMSNRLPQLISGISTQANYRSQRILQDIYAKPFPNSHIVWRSLRATFSIPSRCALFSACGKDWILRPVQCHKMIQIVTLAPIPECFLPEYRVDQLFPLLHQHYFNFFAQFLWSRFPSQNLTASSSLTH